MGFAAEPSRPAPGRSCARAPAGRGRDVPVERDARFGRARADLRPGTGRTVDGLARLRLLTGISHAQEEEAAIRALLLSRRGEDGLLWNGVSSVNGGQNATRKYTSIDLSKPVDEKLFDAPKPQ